MRVCLYVRTQYFEDYNCASKYDTKIKFAISDAHCMVDTAATPSSSIQQHRYELPTSPHRHDDMMVLLRPVRCQKSCHFMA